MISTSLEGVHTVQQDINFLQIGQGFPPFPPPLQAVELYTVKQNSRIQRRGTGDSDDIIYDDNSEDFDEHKQLLDEALKETDVVVTYNK